MAEVWTAQLHIADGSSSEDAPEIAYAERLDDRGQVARLYILAEPERPGSEQFIEDLVTGLGEEFVSGTGSLTGLVQRAIRGRDDDLLDWNRESLPRDQASYGLSCLILREDGGSLAQQGPSLVLYRQGKRLLRRRPAAERSTRALGTAEAGAPEFSQIVLEAGDWALLISSNAGSVLGDEALASLRGLQAEDVLPALYPHVRHVERLSALVVAPEPLTTEFRPLAAASAGEGSDGGEDPGAGAAVEEQADEAAEGEDAAGLPEAPIRHTSDELSEQEPPYAEEVEEAEEAEAALEERTSIGGALAALRQRLFGRGSGVDPWEGEQRGPEPEAMRETVPAGDTPAAGREAGSEAGVAEEAGAGDEAGAEDEGQLSLAGDFDPEPGRGAEDGASVRVAAEEGSVEADSPADDDDDSAGGASAADEGPAGEAAPPGAARDEEETGPTGTVEYRFEAETTPLPRLETQLAQVSGAWPANPFAVRAAPILDTADDVDASRIALPLFGLRGSIPTFRRRAPARSDDDWESRATWRPIALGLSALVVALVVVAGALLVPDLVNDSERTDFDRFVEEARLGLTTATLNAEPEAARSELALALAAAGAALELRPLDANVLLLEQEIAAALEQANAIVRPPGLATLLDLGPRAALGLVQLGGGSVFLLDEAGGRVIALDLESGASGPIFETGGRYLYIGEFADVQASRPVGIHWTGTSSQASLTVLDDEGNLFRFSEAGGMEAYRVPNAEVLGSADGVTSGQAGLYVLDADGGVVWLFPLRSDGSLGSGSPAITRTDLGAATDLVLSEGAGDPVLFIASADGRIRRFREGTDQGFPIVLDRPLLVPASISLGRLSGLIYVVDRGNNRVLAISRNGEIVAQLRDERLAGVRGVQVDEINQVAYYLTASSLLTSTLPAILTR